MPAELAPFLASARNRLEADTDGLQPHEVITHLETAVARAEIEAAQLGIRFEQLLGEADQIAAGDGNPVVVIRRLISPDEA